MRKTAKQREREALDEVMKAESALRCDVGEAQWKNGYRVGKGLGWQMTDDAARVQRDEMACWNAADASRVQFVASLKAYARAIRRAAKEAK